MRDTAAIGIARLLARPAWADSDTAPGLRDALRRLAADPNPVVRMQAAHGLPLIDADVGPPSTIIGHLRVRVLQEQDENVLAVQLQAIAGLTAATPAGEVDQLLEELSDHPQGAFLRQDDPGGEPLAESRWSHRGDVAEVAAAVLTRLAVVDGAPYSARRLSGRLARPIRDADRTKMLIRHLQPYLNPAGRRRAGGDVHPARYDCSGNPGRLANGKHGPGNWRQP